MTKNNVSEDRALDEIPANANLYRHHLAIIGTLLEEVAEYVRALEGKHEHKPNVELIQMGGIVINLLRQYYGDYTL